MDGEVLVVDRITRKIVGTIATGGRPRLIAFDKLGTMAAVADEAGWLDFVR